MDTGRAFFKIQIDRYIFALLLEIPKPTSIYILERGVIILNCFIHKLCV